MFFLPNLTLKVNSHYGNLLLLSKHCESLWEIPLFFANLLAMWNTFFSINMHCRVWIYLICISIENFGIIENVFSFFFTEYNLIQVNFDPENRCWFCKRYTSIWKGDWTLGLDVVQWSVLGPGLCIHFINEWTVFHCCKYFGCLFILSVFWFVRPYVLCHWLCDIFLYRTSCLHAKGTKNKHK